MSTPADACPSQALNNTATPPKTSPTVDALSQPLPSSPDDSDTDTSSSTDVETHVKTKLFPIFSTKFDGQTKPMHRGSKKSFKSKRSQAKIARQPLNLNLQKQATLGAYLAKQVDGPMRDELQRSPRL